MKTFNVDLAGMISDETSKIEKKKMELQSELNQIKEQIAEAYSVIDKTPYDLHAIFIHQGEHAVEGHYYSFIFDH